MAAGLVGRGVVLSILCALTAVIFVEIGGKQNNPYMDEIFHVPQAQNYCHGHFDHWNDKITTLPGLYLSSQILITSLSFLKNQPITDVCSTTELRFINLIFVAIYYLVVYGILQVQQYQTKESNEKESKGLQKSTDRKIFFKSIILTIFPLLYFFSFLYYTDVGSTCLVMLGYYLSLKEYHSMSALTGVLAILFRQTNIVWVGFNAAISVLSHVRSKNINQDKQNIFVDVISIIKECYMNLYSVIKIVLPYCLVFVGFIIFVIKNNGIVVGDRSSHEASFNVPQLFYYSAFLMVFSCHILIRYRSIQKILDGFKQISVLELLLCLIILMMMFVCVYKFTYVHKYLISDNRHYPFYIWRKIFDRHWSVKYLLAPGYFVSWMFILKELNKTRQSVWILVYLLCTAAVLIPQKLLEFRYFIVPYILFQLHIKISSYFELFVECFIYVLVNILTFYLFLYKPFEWLHVDDVQRFMW